MEVLSSQELYILSKRRLARASRLLEAVHNPFISVRISDKARLKLTEQSLVITQQNAESYLSKDLGRPHEAEAIKQKVADRYRRKHFTREIF